MAATFIGGSDPIRQLLSLVERVARTDSTLLITGESGTGKERIARMIHEKSPRGRHPFVPVNCGAIPEGLIESELFGHEKGAFTGAVNQRSGRFELAEGGTLFLDEIGELPLPLQSRLLRVLQEREVLRLGASDPTPVDVRVVAATNHRLDERVAAGAFRQDLYYRLDILPLHLPPLRERREDIPLLAEHLLARALRQHGAEHQLARALRVLVPHAARHPWPGNIRELENVVERLAALCGDAAASTSDGELRALVPELLSAPPDHEDARLASARRRDEEQHIRAVLRECGGNRSAAARRLGVGRTTLWRKLAGGRRSAG